ncbi:MAG: hypothetical protein AB1641_12990 [Thermodesulfobacteriota bacterium]
MKVINIKTLDDCLDRVVTKEFVFDQPTYRAWIMALGELGQVEYYSHFPRPFYRVTQQGVLSIKGVEGRDRCQVLYFHYTSETESTLVQRLHRLNQAASLIGGMGGEVRRVE